MSNIIIDLPKLSSAIKENKKSLSYRKAAEIIGLTAGTVEKIEKQKSLPQLPTYIILCQWLKVDFNFFLKDTSKPNTSVKNTILQLLKTDIELTEQDAKTAIDLIELIYRKK